MTKYSIWVDRLNGFVEVSRNDMIRFILTYPDRYFEQYQVGHKKWASWFSKGNRDHSIAIEEEV